jgi:hypothetical protein
MTNQFLVFVPLHAGHPLQRFFRLRVLALLDLADPVELMALGNEVAGPFAAFGQQMVEHSCNVKKFD